MSSAKSIQVKIEELKTDWFVRTGLNQDHVLHLAELIEAGTQLPPILVTSDMLVVDGRHRIEAYALNDYTSIQAMLVDSRDKVSLIAEAYLANIGGALPPTPADTEHTIKLLVGSGVSMKKIAELISLPPEITRRYVNSVKAKESRQRMAQAVDAVVHGGATVDEAADQFRVKPSALQEQLSGGRRNGNRSARGVPDIHKQLTSQNKSIGQKLKHMVDAAERLHADGDATTAEVLDLMDHVVLGLQRSLSTHVDRRMRFRAANNPSVRDT